MVNININGGRPSSPTKISMTDFRAITTQDGDLAKSSRFLVMLVPPPAVTSYQGKSSYPVDELTYLCESAEIPGRGFMSADVRYYGPNFKMPYQSTYEDINLTFLCRDKFTERLFFDNWMEVINPSSYYDFAYRDSYVSQIHIFTMSDLNIDENQSGTGLDYGQQRYVITLEKAYPVLINSQPVTWADDNFHRLTVTFTYARWHRSGLDIVADDQQSSTYDLVKGGYQIIRNDGTKVPYIL